MARQIVWAANAQRERLEILQYWAERNGSTRYSEKLDGMFRAALRVIASHPKLGRPTNDPGVRLKAIGDHVLFYSYTITEVHVLSVWHLKRNPKDRPY
jgi:plasmid stabilization system protein ParE